MEVWGAVRDEPRVTAQPLSGLGRRLSDVVTYKTDRIGRSLKTELTGIWARRTAIQR